VLHANVSGSFVKLVTRAKEALEFENYLDTVEERHFPEKIVERRQQHELLAAQWD
jgi:hypothetical protein